MRTMGLTPARAIALLLMPLAAYGSECESWNEESFFEAASLEEIETCLTAGADVHARTASGVTPLHHAAMHADSPSVIAALVAAGADPNAGDDEGRTPLHIAASHNSAPVVRALADAGADPHRYDLYGWSALPMATMNNAAPSVAGEILRLLLPEGSLTGERKGLHKTTCWFEHGRAWPTKECYYFAVDENADDETSPIIAFPIVRFRASRAQPRGNPVLHLGGGGPGGPMGLEADLQYVWWEYAELVAGTARDLYVIDPRGVGMSYPRLHCPDTLDAMRESLAREPDDEDKRETLQAHAACKERLHGDGHDPSHYNSAAVARDIEALRHALGVSQWVLWGTSYGSRYALTIARDFPASVEALLLNGAVFPGAAPYPETWASDLARAIERAFDHCARSGDCRKSHRRRFWKLVEEFEESPLTLTDADVAVLSDYAVERLELTGSRLLEVMFTAMYDAEFFYILAQLVEDLEHGGTSTLEEALDTWLGMELDDTYSDPVYRAHYCAEEHPFVDSAAAARDARDANPHIRRGAERALERASDLCEIWDVKPAAGIEDEPVRTSIPTLFLQGALDPATPIHHMEKRLRDFADHHVLVFDGSSHWGAVSGGCAMEAAAHFVRHKRIERRHRRCREQ